MQEIKNRIFGSSARELSEEDLIQIYHDFMVIYGWIPLNEFLDIETPRLWTLNEKVQEEKRKREIFRLAYLKVHGVKET